jgi:nucleoside-diphosphate-sugar epimerase
VANGYLDLPELTESKFKRATFLETRTPGWDSLYLTGDTGRMLSDGSIVMTGRVDGDNQVKVRGMRVQLDDVSRALVQASRGILVDAAVLVRGEDPGNQQLVAYAVFSRINEVNDEQTYLRQLCQELPIPVYMRPVVIMPLGTLPVTDRGKLDTGKLANLPLPEVAPEDDEQFTEQELRLRYVWKSVLGEISTSVSIRRSSDFFSVGGNSLLLLRLRSEIRREFAVDIPLAELFQTSTLELLAARIAGTSKLIEIDWDKETAVDDQTFASDNTTRPVPRKTEGISVLLTGATGFLGSAILRQLADLPQIGRIHCTAIRPDPNGETRRLAVDSPKIALHPGDLTLPNIGMSPDQASNLFNEIDVIIHNGAEVSHMKNYRSLRAANFLSTVELARHAVPRRIPIHYISTGGVARLSGAEVQTETSLAAFRPPVDGSDGYVASKWASEVFLEKVQDRFPEQRFWIHRPSSITGDGVPALDIVHSVLRFSKLMKAVPDLTGSTGAFDFVGVDTVSRDIARCAVASVEKESGADGLMFVHQSGEEVVPVEQLKEYLEGSSGEQFRVLGLGDWVAEAREGGLDEVVASFLLASKGVIRVPLLRKSDRTEA